MFTCPHKVKDGWCEECKADVTTKGLLIPMPTKEEINKRKLEIQESWSEKEKAKRLGVVHIPYEIPEINFIQFLNRDYNDEESLL